MAMVPKGAVGSVGRGLVLRGGLSGHLAGERDATVPLGGDQAEGAEGGGAVLVLLEDADRATPRGVAHRHADGPTVGEVAPREVAFVIGALDGVLEAVVLAEVLEVEGVLHLADQGPELAHRIGDVGIALGTPAGDEPGQRGGVIGVDLDIIVDEVGVDHREAEAVDGRAVVVHRLEVTQLLPELHRPADHTGVVVVAEQVGEVQGVLPLADHAATGQDADIQVGQGVGHCLFSTFVRYHASIRGNYAYFIIFDIKKQYL